MLQELAARTGAAAWAIGSMFFFLAAFIAVVVWVALKRSDEMDARARMPLDGEDGQGIRDQGSGIEGQGSEIADHGTSTGD